MVILVDEVAVSITKRLHAEWSKLNLSVAQICRGVRKLLGTCRQAIVVQQPQVVRFGEFRTLRDRNVRLVRDKDLRVLRWMKICAAREFFEDENRDQRSRLNQTRIQLRLRFQLPHQRIVRRERSRVPCRRGDVKSLEVKILLHA